MATTERVLTRGEQLAVDCMECTCISMILRGDRAGAEKYRNNFERVYGFLTRPEVVPFTGPHAPIRLPAGFSFANIGK